MRLRGNDRLLLSGFVALAMLSVGLKAAAGPPPDGFTDSRPGQLEDELQAVLRAQHFSTKVEQKHMRSPIVVAVRGQCRLSVRDARGGESFGIVFAADARSVGPIRYLYAGRAYASVPGVAVRIGRVEAELQNRFQLRSDAPVPVALATSPGCAPGNFGLEEIRVPG